MSASIALYLASASPRRRELLTLLDYPFRILSVDVAEQRQPDESADDYVQRLAREKSQAGWLACQGEKPVLGADTIVVFQQEVLEKPRDFADAQRILQLLSGNTHTVMTAIALSSPQGCDVILVKSQVTFRELSPDDISHYWQSGERYSRDWRKICSSSQRQLLCGGRLTHVGNGSAIAKILSPFMTSDY